MRFERQLRDDSALLRDSGPILENVSYSESSSNNVSGMAMAPEV